MRNLILTTAAVAATATPELSDTSFVGKHIEFSITYRYGSDVQDLYREKNKFYKISR